MFLFSKYLHVLPSVDLAETVFINLPIYIPHLNLHAHLSSSSHKSIVLYQLLYLALSTFMSICLLCLSVLKFVPRT